MALFRRSAPDLDRFVRTDVSLVSELHSDTVAAMPARSTSTNVPRRVSMLLERPDPDTDYRATVHAGTLAMFWHGYATLLLDLPAPRTNSVTVLDPLGPPSKVG